MSEFEKWALGALGVVLASLLTPFGREKLAAMKGARRFAEAGESVQIDALTQLQQIASAAVLDAAKLRGENEALRATVAEMDKRLTLLQMLHQSEEDQQRIWKDSGLLDPTRALRVAPPKPPAPSGHDPFQAHVVYGRRATDKPR